MPLHLKARIQRWIDDWWRIVFLTCDIIVVSIMTIILNEAYKYPELTTGIVMGILLAVVIELALIFTMLTLVRD